MFTVLYMRFLFRFKTKVDKLVEVEVYILLFYASKSRIFLSTLSI